MCLLCKADRSEALKTEEHRYGESHSIEKTIQALPAENLVPGDQLNMLFKGTIVSKGSAKAVSTTTRHANRAGQNCRHDGS